MGPEGRRNITYVRSPSRRFWFETTSPFTVTEKLSWRQYMLLYIIFYVFIYIHTYAIIYRPNSTLNRRRRELDVDVVCRRRELDVDVACSTPQAVFQNGLSQFVPKCLQHEWFLRICIAITLLLLMISYITTMIIFNTSISSVSSIRLQPQGDMCSLRLSLSPLGAPVRK